MPNINLKNVYDIISQDYEAGLKERKDARATGISALKEAISLFDESYGKGAEKTALADYEQSAVSRGLSGSTRGAAVSTGMKHQFEDIRRGRLNDALAQLAQFLSSFQSGAPTAGNLGYIATGGFGAQSALEQQRFEQEQASYPSIISGGQQGLGYQPASTLSPSNFSRGGSTSGTVSDSGGLGSAWGGLAKDIAKETEQPRQTIAGMWATKDKPLPPENPPAPYSPGSAYQGEPGGGYWYQV